MGLRSFFGWLFGTRSDDGGTVLNSDPYDMGSEDPLDLPNPPTYPPVSVVKETTGKWKKTPKKTTKAKPAKRKTKGRRKAA